MKLDSDLLQKGKSVALASPFAIFAPQSFAVPIDVTDVTAQITTDGTAAIVAVGTALIVLAAVAVTFKWVKGTIFN